MPLLDLTSSQHSFQIHLLPLGARSLYHVNYMRFSYLSRSFKIPTQKREFNVKVQSWGMLVNAVATLEPKISVESDAHDDHRRMILDVDTGSQGVDHQSTSEEFTHVDDKEKLRRMRISKANKGNTPWNKGRKHSPETLRKIREKTKLAMQDPKVKMKLASQGHAQSKETRIKIGVGVRMGWNKRREKLMLQETCHFDWQNLIAEASRRGLAGEEELQWDSYKILDEQLQREWLESVDQRKRSPRPKGSKRAPKSAEQRRRISEAIAAKWADPAYRDRVYSGLSKYHGTPIGADNPRRRQKRASSSTSTSKKKKNVTDNSARNTTKSTTQQTIKKKSKMPIYTDPLASSKLEMIKNIRADRENKKAEAITRAKLLIVEAEKAAKALELAAAKSPLAQASLFETRKLIAEAIQSIESIEGVSDENDSNILSGQTVSSVEKEIDSRSDGLFTKNQIEINGSRALLSNFDDISDSAFEDFNLQELLSREDELLPSSSYDVDFMNDKEYLKELLNNGTNLSQYETLHQKIEPSSFTHQPDHLTPNGSNIKHGNLVRNGAKSELWEKESLTKSTREGKPPKSIKTIKKWVRGKLVEVREED
ncbi:IENR2 domain-containing protein [Heracleum sosnowskyi]|uniref:IENR2 domain-containing protein n=1 Tax=Heracleum sosnowskyi TaxID=360622 RepID=A0AAD8H1J3_9APIA|nr:IENR2 domain-containing protein [Heracleum sosnowskyi]